MTTMNQTINGDRLKQAREIRGFTQAELAERIGVSQSTIAQLESNNKQLILQPSERIIEAIAFQTGFSVPFFYQDSPPEFPLGSLLFRSRRSLLKREDKARVHQLGWLIYETAEKMAKRGRSNIQINVPRVGNEDPATAAHIARAALGLSPHMPVRNLLNQLEKNGVFVLALPLSIEEHDSYSVWADTQPRRPVIIISNDKPGDRQRFNLAHELGHLVMHDSFPEGLKKIEDEADRFAGEFLLPEEAMRSAIETPVTLASLAELKPRWGVSISALIVRARHLAIITDRQAKYLHQQMRNEKWDKKEPQNLHINAEKPRAFKRMAEVLHGVPVDVAKVAAYNLAPVNLIKMVMDAHADKPNRPAEEKKQEAARSNVVSIRSRR
jgi:Zn-dependent peptidase ImmA (M78 family)/transcriptional regulator with XRE-family HTH domain